MALGRAFGCARVVYNDALAMRRAAHESGRAWIPDSEVLRRVTVEAKTIPERAWLAEVSSVVLQQSVADCNTAYRNFFNSLSGKRKGRKMGPPRFRSRKDHRQAIRFTRNAHFRVLPSGKLRLPKVGDVEVRWSRDLPSEPSSATVILDAAGRYHVSFVVAIEGDETLPPVDDEIGIDLGLTHFAVMSNGRKIEAPRFLRKAERRLKHLQQALSRKTKGSTRRKKAVVKVAKAHAKVADTRRDWHHKLSTTLIRENQAIYVEDLCVTGLARTRMAKSVHDAGWSQFVNMLEYKATRYGRHLGKINRWFPSTRMCDTCRMVGPKLPLHIRSWTCQCGATHDRDINAAHNILAEGRSERLNDRGARTRPARVPVPRRAVIPASVPASRDEAATHRKAVA
jgi:putative transposase